MRRSAKAVKCWSTVVRFSLYISSHESDSKMPSPTAVICVTFEIHPEHFDAFLIAVKKQSKDSLEKESWCHQFDVCLSPDRPTAVLLYETYDDREAVKKHMQTPHFAIFNATVGPMIKSKDVHVWDIDAAQ